MRSWPERWPEASSWTSTAPAETPCRAPVATAARPTHPAAQRTPSPHKVHTRTSPASIKCFYFNNTICAACFIFVKVTRLRRAMSKMHEVHWNKSEKQPFHCENQLQNVHMNVIKKSCAVCQINCQKTYSHTHSILKML